MVNGLPGPFAYVRITRSFAVCCGCQQLSHCMQVQSAAKQASPVKSADIEQLRSGQPDSALVKRLQAQLSEIAAHLEAVTGQLAASKQTAIEEQRKAQVCPRGHVIKMLLSADACTSAAPLAAFKHKISCFPHDTLHVVATILQSVGMPPRQSRMASHGAGCIVWQLSQ